MKEMKEKLLFKPSKRAIFMLVCCVILNIVGHIMAEQLKLPWMLDTIGTMTSAIALGPIAGVITGTSASLVIGMTSSAPAAYALANAAVGLVVGLLFPRKRRDDMLSIVSVAMLSALVSTLICLPINAIYYDGYTSNIWGDSLYDMLSQMINSDRLNSFASQFFVDMPDRVLSIFMALWLADNAIIRHYSSKGSDKKNKNNKNGGEKKEKTVKKAPAALALLMMIGFAGAQLDFTAHAADIRTGFEPSSFSFKEGLPSSEINSVAQTKDGFIWVGTYSGLYMYDGVRFEKAQINNKIKSVMTLFVDSKSRLWIGTNDSGVICYDPATGDSAVFNTQSGLPADSVRAICEDGSGNIYIGSVLSLAKITKDSKIKTYSEFNEIFYATSLCAIKDDMIAGVTRSGVLFSIKNDLLTFSKSDTGKLNASYRSVSYAEGILLVGTSSNYIEKYEPSGDSITYNSMVTVSTGSTFNKMVYDARHGGIFFCCDKGLGFMDKSGRAQDLSTQGFNDSITDICIDDQSNIWVTSSKQGLLKYARTPFSNVTRLAEYDSEIVNAIMHDNGKLFIGTDNGLRLINSATGKEMKASYLSLLNGERIRHIFKDSKGNIWISSYGSKGLIKIDTLGQVKHLYQLEPQLAGKKFRFVNELSDGSIVASTNKGLVFIKDDKVTAALNEKNGLNNQVILSIAQRDDGTILAGSDGDGIYVIKNNSVIGRIGKNEGLDTLVVLRIVKCSKGYLYVTSNAIYHDDGSSITQLDNFPYTNNYDIYIKDGECWITSSAGLYIVPEEQLLKNDKYVCTLLNERWGLNTSFTANSWNESVDDDLFLCCIDGVRKISTEEYDAVASNYQLHLKSIISGEEYIYLKDGKWVIPATSDRIQFNVSVSNYSMSNPLVHYYLEGSKDNGITCYQSEITPLSFTNLPYGNYKLHIQILDDMTDQIEKEAVIDIEKQAMMYEKIYFKAYYLLVCVCLVMYIVWLFYTINKRAIRIRGLQMEVSTDPMTGLLNKAGSAKTLTSACLEETGTLLMIDLDSFKLVNDLYGHDMGDKILIRFAELIRQTLGEGDISGRIGGDEFTAFMRNTMDEEDTERFTKSMNREILASAKEYMGEDMNIPLGVSVGAVRVPVDGRDYHELSKLADKALYVVKQNGKHGYSFYQKSSISQDLDSDGRDNNNLEQIKIIIGERNEGKGAYVVSFDKMQVIYKFLCRNVHVNESTVGFIRMTLDNSSTEKITNEIKDEFEDFLTVNLKKNDVISRYSGSFFVLCIYDVPDGFESIQQRIKSGWEEKHPDMPITFEFETVD